MGWASNDNPMMVFRNLIAKPRREKVKKDAEQPLIQPTQIGNDIVNIEAMRYQLRTQVCSVIRYLWKSINFQNILSKIIKF